ncbi:MAG: hypothetical protein U0X73_12560 [Thermoanaerobaculia bacterium]
MTYPGDPALTPEVQKRILTTFQQTLELAAKASHQEALLGCDFILRLDPQFRPARSLQQSLANPGAPLGLASLAAAAGLAAPSGSEPGAAGGGRGEDSSFGDLNDLALELPATLPSATAGADLKSQLGELVNRRKYSQAIQLAEAQKRIVAVDPELRKLAETAHSRLEAEPYLKTFLESARQAIKGGEYDEAERLIKKARSLDPAHPEIAEVEQTKLQYQDPSRVMGARRRGISIEEPPPAADLELPELDFGLGGSSPAALGGGFELGGSTSPSESGEGSGRISELLREGQAAFDRGEYQAAIDAWSRIFLIDIDHQEAARRIEHARQLKAEREREVEEIFHDGVGRFDTGDLDGARTAFQRVLELSPSYAMANDYLERIESRRSAPEARPAVAPPPELAPRVAAPGKREKERDAERLSEEILVPPEPGAEGASATGVRERPAFAATARKGTPRPTSRFALIGGAVLLLVGAGGWFLWSNRARLFPNTQNAEASSAAAVDPLARARSLHGEGKTAIAIAQLRRLPPQDPHYAEAQSLISQWEALVKPADDRPAVTPEQLGRRSALLQAAQQAMTQGEFLRASGLFDQAAAIAPLDSGLGDLARQAKDRLEPLAKELEMYKQGDFEILLNQAWRKFDQDRNNRDLRRLIIDSYYNLAVFDLQRGDARAALDKLHEALKLDASDPMLQRLERFATTYTVRSEDLLFRIFVKYLPTR